MVAMTPAITTRDMETPATAARVTTAAATITARATARREEVGLTYLLHALICD